MTARHWVLALLLIVVMTFLGARFLYGYGHSHACAAGRICVDEPASSQASAPRFAPCYTT